MNKPGPPSPSVLFIDKKIYIDPDEVTRDATAVMLSGAVRSVPSNNPIDFTGSAGLLPNLSIWTAQFRLEAKAVAEGGSARQLILFPGSGQVLVDRKAESLACGEGYGVNLEVEDPVVARLSQGQKGPGLMVMRQALIQRLAVLIDAPVQRPLIFDTRFDADAHHQGAVGKMIEAVLTPDIGNAITSSPATASALAATLIDLILNCLPHNYRETLLRPPLRIAPKHIKRAVDYIDGQVHAALSVDEVAAACDVSIRSLQYGFRQFLDVSPADYIRDVRLERARVDMVRDPQLSLTQIASRWGFANLARFNNRFRNSYGETPAAYRTRHGAEPSDQT